MGPVILVCTARRDHAYAIHSRAGHGRQPLSHAGAAPYANRVFTDFFGPKVDASSKCYVNHVLYQWDFSTICMK